MPDKELEIKTDKLYYTIGEVSKMFGVRTSLIRFWEKEFSIIKPKKNKKGNRLFTKKDIDNLQSIYKLVKKEGFTLEGAKQKLKSGGTDDLNRNLLVVESLTEMRSELLALMDKI